MLAFSKDFFKRIGGALFDNLSGLFSGFVCESFGCAFDGLFCGRHGNAFRGVANALLPIACSVVSESAFVWRGDKLRCLSGEPFSFLQFVVNFPPSRAVASSVNACASALEDGKHSLVNKWVAESQIHKPVLPRKRFGAGPRRRSGFCKVVVVHVDWEKLVSVGIKPSLQNFLEFGVALVLRNQIPRVVPLDVAGVAECANKGFLGNNCRAGIEIKLLVGGFRWGCRDGREKANADGGVASNNVG